MLRQHPADCESTLRAARCAATRAALSLSSVQLRGAGLGISCALCSRDGPECCSLLFWLPSRRAGPRHAMGLKCHKKWGSNITKNVSGRTSVAPTGACADVQ